MLLCIAEGTAAGRSQSAAPDARALFQIAGKEMRIALRRSARGLRQHAGDRAALRLHARAAQSRSCRPSRATAGLRRGRGAARRRARRARRGGSKRQVFRPGHGPRPSANGAARPYRERLAIRARHHHPHGLRRLFPDRRRVHPMGQIAGHSGRAGARLGRRLGGGLGAHHHRSRSACASACCSSASSIPSACRCPISTSISARTGATR